MRLFNGSHTELIQQATEVCHYADVYMYVVISLYMRAVIYNAVSKHNIANILLTIKRFYGYVCHFFALQVARLLYSEHSHCLDANIFALDLLFVCDIGDLSLFCCSRDC